ncbi:MAG: hypothetical protein JWN95_298 [Frankiales bacterium]|nr:hypothetical protein [Frankiales bacterium]
MSALVSGVVILDAEDSALFAACARQIRAAWRANGAGVPASVEVALRHLTEAAVLYHATRTASVVASDSLPLLDEMASVALDCVWLSASEAAVELGISSRAVRDAAESGRLAGRKRGGGRGAWQVTQESVAEYAAARERRATGAERNEITHIERGNA